MTTISSIGDLANSYQLRRDTGRIKDDLTRLTRELSSGVTDDLVSKFKGNFEPLSGIERGLARMDSFSTVIAEHQLVVSAFQTTLGNLRGLADISNALLLVPETGDPTLLDNAGRDALSRFSSVLSNLNTSVGGRSIFSGVQTDGASVADADTILSALEVEIGTAAAVTAPDVIAVVDNWFSAGGGFDTIGYLGGAPMGSGPELSDGETAPPPLTAEDESIREYLSAMSLGGLLGRGVLAGDIDQRSDLARMVGERMLAGNTAIVELQSEIGTVEAQVERASVEVSTEMDSLQLAKASLIEVDPFEAAIKLQNSETQLQTIYAITARLSRLSLVGYL